jgi:hypothetical protein
MSRGLAGGDAVRGEMLQEDSGGDDLVSGGLAGRRRQRDAAGSEEDGGRGEEGCRTMTMGGSAWRRMGEAAHFSDDGQEA